MSEEFIISIERVRHREREDMSIAMGDFGIAPDHIHGIIYTGRNEYNRGLPSFYYDKLRDAMPVRRSLKGEGGPGVSRGHPNSNIDLEQEINICYNQEILGHGSSKTTEIYTHVISKAVNLNRFNYICVTN